MPFRAAAGQRSAAILDERLTLAEWLQLGKESGRGLEIELKEPEHMQDMIEEIKASGVPSHRLMLNVNADTMKEWGPALRREFPDATLALSHCGDGDKLTAEDVRHMIDSASERGVDGMIDIRESPGPWDLVKEGLGIGAFKAKEFATGSAGIRTESSAGRRRSATSSVARSRRRGVPVSR